MADAGRISATGAMTVSPYWEREGAVLRDFRAKIAVGLHFTLTDLGPISAPRTLAPDGRFPGLRPLLGRAFARRVPAEEIRRELEAQLDRFEAVMGGPPDYLDGHHHVHNLPVVRDVVLEVLGRRFGNKMFLRYCDEPAGGIARRGGAVAHALIISRIGATLAERGRAAGFPGNTGFRGVRTFTDGEDAARLFTIALKEPRAHMMVMCHPGHGEPAPDINDEISGCRKLEYDYLMSDAWPALLAAAGVELRRPGA